MKNTRVKKRQKKKKECFKKYEVFAPKCSQISTGLAEESRQGHFFQHFCAVRPPGAGRGARPPTPPAGQPAPGRLQLKKGKKYIL